MAVQQAGKVSGDLTFPIPYTPELHFKEFNSAVADMKNSVMVSSCHVYVVASSQKTRTIHSMTS